MTSTLKIDTIEPEGATTTLAVGESGQNTVIAGAGIKANVAKDAGANAIFTSDGSGSLSGMNSAFGSAQVLLSTLVASSSSSIDFTTAISGAFTSTYKEYVFTWINIQAASASDTQFKFYASDNAGSDFEVNQTTTFWNAYQTEAGAYEFGYSASYDQANGWDTTIVPSMINGSDNSSSGELHLFNPSSTTYVKNWFSRGKTLADTGSRDAFASGYFNMAAAVTGVRFIMTSGNITAGKIKMYGIK